MQFANAHLSWLFLAGIISGAFCWWQRVNSRRQLENFVDISLWDAVIPDFNRHGRKRLLESAFAVMVVLAAIFSLLRPQWGFVWQKGHKRGVDIVLAVDVSHSMLAEDISPTRLERVRREILDLLSHLQGDRVALVTFAGTAFLQTPFTVDYGTFRSFVDSLSPDLIPLQGSNLEGALRKSMQAIKQKNSKVSSAREHAIILFTDGESFSGDLSAVRAEATASNTKIFIIGVGTETGSPIKLPDGRYKKNNLGETVISRLNEEPLKQLAAETGGIYVKSITSDGDTEIIYDSGIKQTLSSSTVEGSRKKQWNEYFQLPLSIAILFLLLPCLAELLHPATGLLKAFKFRLLKKASRNG